MDRASSQRHRRPSRTFTLLHADTVRWRTERHAIRAHRQPWIDAPVGPNRRATMQHAYWSDWYFGWGWFLWLGIVVLFFSSVGNWGYTYRAHRRFGGMPRGDALDILDARYAKGDITRDEYALMKSEISVSRSTGSRQGG
jgi:putative membrane protein